MIDFQLQPAEFHRRLVWFMCADPWPEPDVEFDAPSTMTRNKYEAHLNDQARRFGFDNWLDAYHRFNPAESQADAALRLAFTTSPARDTGRT